MSTLLPYQERVVDEYKELTEKINNLEKFIKSEMFALLSNKESELLIEQNSSMLNYQNILSQRINLWKHQ